MWRIFIVIGVVLLAGVAVIVCGPEIAKSSEETRKRVRKAKMKAKKFLKEQLLDELRIEYERKGHMAVRSKLRNGRTYELHADSSVYLVDGKSRRKLCINFSQDLPAEDKVLTVLRNIQADEKGFLRSVGQAV